MRLYTLADNRIQISDELKNVDFSMSCDVLCVGAGAAGIYASESACREGCDVILLESSTCIGGMHIRGNVCSYYYGDEGGSYLDIDENCNRNVFLAGNQQPETKQVLIYKKLKKAGVKILCRHFPIGVYMEDNQVIGILVLSDKGTFSIRAKIVIDSTSDGYIVRMCPVEKTYGRKIDGKTVPFTVRTQYFSNGCFMSINTDSGYTNQYDKDDFSKKTILAHANGAKYFDKGAFINVASQTGIREGLSFAGESTIEYKDIIFDRKWDKVLFYAYSDLDKHGYDFALDEDLFQNWFVISNLSTVTFSIAVPFGCVVPKNIKGLVTAGRCISGDSYSVSSIRMNRDMFRMGECVGIAVSLAVKENCDFLNIDYDKYLEKVKRHGCYKSDKQRKVGFDHPSKASGYIYRPVEFGVKKNLNMLETTAPGVAVWSCYISDEKSKDAEIIFSKMMSAKTVLEKYNCAICLGIMKDLRCLDVLRDIIVNRDNFLFTDCRRTNQFRTSIAICLLGRLGSKDDIALLEEIVFSEKEFGNPMYKSDKVTVNGYHNPVYFDVFTHACMSLVKLCKAHNTDMLSLHQRFLKLFDKDKIIKRVTSAQYGNPEFMEIYDFQNHILKITDNKSKNTCKNV